MVVLLIKSLVICHVRVVLYLFMYKTGLFFYLIHILNFIEHALLNHLFVTSKHASSTKECALRVDVFGMHFDFTYGSLKKGKKRSEDFEKKNL